MKKIKMYQNSLFYVLSFILIFCLLIQILKIDASAQNQRWSFNFDNIGCDVENFGWEAAYGGDLEITNEDSRSGNYCLKMTNRTQAWHSPALSMDRIFNEGGTGRYSITAWVKVVNVNTTLRQLARTLIRATDVNTFINQYSNNFYYPIKCVTLPESEWICIQGYVSVYPEDIHQGNFKFMLDVIDPMDGQILYLDDVTFFKLSDDPRIDGFGVEEDENGEQHNIIYKKHFVWQEYLDGAYGRYNDITYIDEAIAYYYDLLQEAEYTQHSETVFTLSTYDATRFAQDIAPAALEELEQVKYNKYISDVNKAFSDLIGIFPEISDVSTAIDIAGFFESVLNSTDQAYTNFYVAFANTLLTPSKTQTDVTYSICLLRHKTGLTSFSNQFQYKVVCSDGRAFCNNIDEDFYNALFKLCSVYVDGKTHNKPTIYKVPAPYLYTIYY